MKFMITNIILLLVLGLALWCIYALAGRAINGVPLAIIGIILILVEVATAFYLFRGRTGYIGQRVSIPLLWSAGYCIQCKSIDPSDSPEWSDMARKGLSVTTQWDFQRWEYRVRPNQRTVPIQWQSGKWV